MGATSSPAGRKTSAVHHLDGGPEEADPDLEHGHKSDPEQLEVLLNAMGELDGDHAGEIPENDDELFDEKEAKEVLATMIKEHSRRRTFAAVNAAKKTTALARGFGSAARMGSRKGPLDGSYKLSIETLKRRTRCANCGELGHWHRECPRKGGKAAGKQGDRECGPPLGVRRARGLVRRLQFLKMKRATVPNVSTSMHHASSSSTDIAASRPPGIHRPHHWHPHEIMFLGPPSRLDEDLCMQLQRTAVGSKTLNRLIQKQPANVETVFKPEQHHFRAPSMWLASLLALVPKDVFSGLPSSVKGPPRTLLSYFRSLFYFIAGLAFSFIQREAWNCFCGSISIGYHSILDPQTPFASTCSTFVVI